MRNYLVLCAMMYELVTAESPIDTGIKPSNILGGPEQHASFNFIRPGFTQASYSFNGPSSHQSFSSSIDNPQLNHKFQPNVANILSHQNSGHGYFANGPISTAFTSSPHSLGSLGLSASSIQPYNQLSTLDEAAAFTFLSNGQSDLYQNQLNPLLALRQAQLLQFPTQGQAHLPVHQSQNPEHQLHQQQQHQPQNLLGVTYSSAPAVAHVKFIGNGYKYNF